MSCSQFGEIPAKRRGQLLKEAQELVRTAGSDHRSLRTNLNTLLNICRSGGKDAIRDLHRNNVHLPFHGKGEEGGWASLLQAVTRRSLTVVRDDKELEFILSWASWICC